MNLPFSAAWLELCRPLCLLLSPQQPSKFLLFFQGPASLSPPRGPFLDPDARHSSAPCAVVPCPDMAAG